MTFPYRIDTDWHLARVDLAGVVTGPALAETVRAVFLDPLWRWGFDTLWDGTSATKLVLRHSDHRRLTSVQYELAAVAGPGRDVLLIREPPPDVIAKIYVVFGRSGPRDVFVCRSEREARTVLSRVRTDSAAS